MGDTQADFGPFCYRDESKTAHDYDGDGITETISEELDGLTGAEVTLEGEPAGRSGISTVLTINGSVCRAPESAPPLGRACPTGAPGPPAGLPAGRLPFAGRGSK